MEVNPKFNNRPNKNVWLSRAVAVQMFLIAHKDGENYVLVSQRGPKTPDPQFVGSWNVVTGYLDWDETLQECAIRETYEETGVYLPIIATHFDVIHADWTTPWYARSIPRNRQNVSIGFGMYIDLKDEHFPQWKIQDQGEVSDVMWLNVSLLDKVDWAFEHNERIGEYIVRLELQKKLR